MKKLKRVDQIDQIPDIVDMMIGEGSDKSAGLRVLFLQIFGPDGGEADGFCAVQPSLSGLKSPLAMVTFQMPSLPPLPTQLLNIS